MIRKKRYRDRESRINSNDFQSSKLKPVLCFVWTWLKNEFKPVSTSQLDIMVLRNFYFCVKQFEILLVFQFKFKTLPLSLLNCCENEWVLWISNSKMYLLAFLINNYGVWLFQRVKSCLRSVCVELNWHWPMLKDSEVS